MARRKSHYARPPERQAYTDPGDSRDRADGGFAYKTSTAGAHAGSPRRLNRSANQRTLGTQVEGRELSRQGAARYPGYLPSGSRPMQDREFPEAAAPR